MPVEFRDALVEIVRLVKQGIDDGTIGRRATRAQAAIARAARERGYVLESATYTPVVLLEMGDGIGGWDVRLSCGRGWAMAGGANLTGVLADIAALPPGDVEGRDGE